MDQILITYRGGYGDIYSIMSSYQLNRKCKITFLVEEDHAFLKNLYPYVNFIKNPTKLCQNKIDQSKIAEHIRIKENKNFNQRLYDESVIEVAFQIWSEYQPYYDFYEKLINSHDLVITNYLDLTAIKACEMNTKEWWLIKSWYDWPKDSHFLNMLNKKSPYRNIYYYEKEWIKGFETDPIGEYQYMDTDFYKKGTNESEERFKLFNKIKNKDKIFFASLGSMSKHNLGIGRDIKYLFLKKINELFNDGWYGITTQNEYDMFLKNNTPEKWLFVTKEWYPHDIVFDYISLFLTHGGAGSFSRAMKKNKKMIVFPFQLDQFYFGQIAKNYYDGEMIV